ncbi:MAG TPA: TolC family protein [Candidatus Binatia bacterium]|nr:TolC family protein [Candidatus Binatia bacterium]
MTRWFFLVVLTIGASPLLGAELRLDEAIERARNASPDLRAAAVDLEGARARLGRAQLPAANPVLSGDIARHTEAGEATIDRGVALAQEVEVGGQRGLRIAAARLDVARATHALADRRRRVDTDVRRAFFTLAARSRRRAVAADRAAVAERLADAVRRRARAGDAAALDQELATVEAARAAQALAVAVSDEADATAALAVAIGARVGDELTVSAPDPDLGDVGPAAALVARALADRPDLAAARDEEARLSTEAVLARRTGIVPNPVVKAFYRQERFNERIAGGELSIPLPIWNREQATETSLHAAAAAARADALRLAGEVERQVHVALARRAAAAAAWERYRRETRPAVASAREHLRRGATAGYVGVPETLVQEDRLFQAEELEIDAWRDAHLATADLVDALGSAAP